MSCSHGRIRCSSIWAACGIHQSLPCWRSQAQICLSNLVLVRRTGTLLPGDARQQASSSHHPTPQPPSKPQFPVFTGSRTASRNTSPARASAKTLAVKPIQLGDDTPSSPSLSPHQADPPVRHMLASRPQSSSSQHQLHDLGFEDVDLDSPDAGVSKTRSDHAPPIHRNQITPIPFMQHACRDNAPSGQLQTDEFDLLDPDRAESPSKTSEPNTPYPFAPPVQAVAAASALPASALHLTIDQEQLQHGEDLHESMRGSSTAYHEEAGPLVDVPSASGAGHLPQVPSVSGAGPFSTYSGPGSTSSSTPASPSAAPLPTRRSSFLPRGMSTHIHKALKATAAAASKASAAIAPPPNYPLPASSWQEGVSAEPQQPAMSLPIPRAGQDEEFPFQQPWGLSGPASTGNQEKKETGKPWWQQQLRNLQQNLHSPQQLQSDSPSDSGADSDADNTPVTHSAVVNGDFQAQHLGDNGDVPAPRGDPTAHLRGDQQAGSVLHPMGFAPPPSDPEPPRQPGSPHTAAEQHSDSSPDSRNQHGRQMDMDRMRIMESLGDADSMSMSMSMSQDQLKTPSLAALTGEGVGLDQQAAAWQGQVSNSLPVSGGPGRNQVRQLAVPVETLCTYLRQLFC